MEPKRVRENDRPVDSDFVASIRPASGCPVCKEEAAQLMHLGYFSFQCPRCSTIVRV